MDAAGLEGDYRVGEWLIEPHAARASNGDQSVTLTSEQLRILTALAQRHGEAVLRRTLRTLVWPGQPGSEERLREAIAALRAIFGDRPRHPQYIATVGQDAYALIAHYERVEPPPPAPVAESRWVGQLHHVLGELHRRNVIKVGASYLVGMWVVLQVAEVTFEPLRFPAWWATALTILAILGLPIVVVLAWMYEITPSGIVVDTGGASLGRVNLPRPRKSIAPVILAGVVLMAGVTGFAWWRTLEQQETAVARKVEAPRTGPPSIAVLPLVDMSPSGGNSYLGDGLSEELSTRLAQIPGLRVAARTSAFGFKGKNIDVRKIGQSLDVTHVLEGSVRRDGDAVRVTVQLIDTRTGYHVWAGNFDRSWHNLLTVQDDVANSVTSALRLVLQKGGDEENVRRTRALDGRALDPYLTGLALLRKPSDASNLRKAEAAFRESISHDATFAGAHAGLCRVLARDYERSKDATVRPEAEAACRRALQLDDSLIDTERALAELQVASGEFQQAISTYAGLIERDPHNADFHIGMGEALAGAGRVVEAEASYRRAVAEDPSYSGAHTSLAAHLFERGMVPEVVVALRKATELAPASARVWSNLGGALQMAGDTAGAAAAFRHSLQLEPSKEAYSNLGTLQYYNGQYAEAAATFERAVALGEHDQMVHGNLADALWWAPGRREEAVAVYRRAIGLAEMDLGVTSEDPTLKAQLGYYYGRVGDLESSRRYLDEASRAGPDVAYVQYYRAVAAVDRGDRDTSLDAMAQMIRLGFTAEMIRNGPEFAAMLDDPEYRRLTESGEERSKQGAQGGK
jgi:TolB-like protein/Flp pilus assembly protein TadD/DNA-binding winged helix-turn-helix (wHTH) protein